MPCAKVSSGALELLVNVRRVPPAWELLPITLGEHDHVARRDLSGGSLVPPPMNEVWSTPDQGGVPIAIVLEADEVDARLRC